MKENKTAPQRLAELRGKAIALVTESLLRDESDVVRHEAAFILGEKAEDPRREEILDCLCSAAADPSILVRHEVALALAKFPSEKSVKQLFKLARDRSDEVSGSAEYALVDMLSGTETAGK